MRVTWYRSLFAIRYPLKAYRDIPGLLRHAVGVGLADHDEHANSDVRTDRLRGSEKCRARRGTRLPAVFGAQSSSVG